LCPARQHRTFVLYSKHYGSSLWLVVESSSASWARSPSSRLSLTSSWSIDVMPNAHCSTVDKPPPARRPYKRFRIGRTQGELGAYVRRCCHRLYRLSLLFYFCCYSCHLTTPHLQPARKRHHFSGTRGIFEFIFPNGNDLVYLSGESENAGYVWSSWTTPSGQYDDKQSFIARTLG
jgi:hypothetical protein